MKCNIIQWDSEQGTPLKYGGQRIKKAILSVTYAIGHILNRIGTPGLVRETTINDELTGASLSIRVSKYFTVISVDGKDFYFKRLSGKYDGSGMCQGCSR